QSQEPSLGDSSGETGHHYRIDTRVASRSGGGGLGLGILADKKQSFFSLSLPTLRIGKASAKHATGSRWLHRLVGRRATYYQDGVKPFATMSVPRVDFSRRGRISWYSGESYHAWNAVIDGNSRMTVRECSIDPLYDFRFFIEGDNSPLMRLDGGNNLCHILID